MGLDEYAVITQTTAPQFVKSGGEIEYELVVSKPSEKIWVIYGRKPDGTKIKCIIPRTGVQKNLKSIHALMSFHELCYPDSACLTIPTKICSEYANAIYD